MRLIDADELLQDIRENMPNYEVKGEFLNYVNEQPTAYSVEKVVEEVKKLSFEWLGDIRTCDVIRLVRKGGVE